VDERLLIPVSLLPGPLPVGCILWVDDPQVDLRCPAVLYIPPDAQTPHMACVTLLCGDDSDETGQAMAFNVARLSLDLSPPETDLAGWPMRIDGLDVAAGMLARAMGANPAEALRWRVCGLGDRLATFLVDGLGRGWTSNDNRAAWWTLADIDPTDALAPRLAMAAVLRARPWVRS
jgi:hypothetical protein